MPELVDVESRLSVPAQVLGQLVGVLVVESPLPVAFDDDDAAALRMIATMVANAVELDRATDESTPRAAPAVPVIDAAGAPSVLVRFFPIDGSVFLDGDYLIRGVAGRILWSVLNQSQKSGRVEFTNKEVRLDPSLDLPGFRDNLDTRLILLKRRLEERGATIRIEKTGRGRFRLHVATPLFLEAQT